MFDNSCHKVITIAIIIMSGQASVLYSAVRNVHTALRNVHSPLRNIHTAVGNITQTGASLDLIIALVINTE